MDGPQICITKRINLFFKFVIKYQLILIPFDFRLKQSKIFYRLFTGVIFPPAESFLDDVGVLLVFVRVSYRVYII